MSSLSCLLCAHTCTLALTLVSRLPSGRRVCVTLGVIGILSDLFGLPFCFLAFVKAGGPWTLGWHGPTKTHPSCRENVPAWCTWAAHYKTQLVATFFLFLFLCKVLMQLQSRTARRHLVIRSIDDFFWNGWPPELFGTSAGWTSSSFLGVLTCTLRKWNPRPACGTAFSSVHPILSVYICTFPRQALELTYVVVNVRF